MITRLLAGAGIVVIAVGLSAPVIVSTRGPAAGSEPRQVVVLAGKGDDAWAARILGARDAVTERTGATVVDKSVDDLREQAERQVRARLGPDRWTRAYAAGRSTSIDSLVKDIDNVLRRRAGSV